MLESEFGKLRDRTDLLLLDADIARSQWENRLIVPYNSAYIGAFNSYKENIEKDKQDKKKILEMTFLVLSLCGGTMLTTVLAGSIRTAFGNALLKAICDRNMNKTFSVYSYVSNSNSAKFALNGALGMLKSSVTGEIKRSFEGGFTALSNNLQKNPLEVYAALSAMNNTAHAAVSATVKSLIRNRDSIPLKTALDVCDNIGKSSFMSPPPQSRFGDDLSNRIELSFYLNDILNSDYLTIIKGHNRTAKNIDAIPGDKNYPKNFFGGRASIRRIDYKDIGGNVVERINKLYRSVMGVEENFVPPAAVDLFASKPSPQIIVKASKALDKIATQGQTMFKAA